jgi:hypothetical protein
VRGRPVIDVVVLAFAATVCVVLILVAVAMTLAGSVPPNAPTAGRYVDLLMTATATLLGALLGILAGRSASRQT